MFMIVILPAVVIVAAWWNRGFKTWYRNISRRSSGDVDCIVCLSKICRGEKVRMLPLCHHCFHGNCIEAWLQVSPTCPLCRIDVAHSHSIFSTFLLSPIDRIGKWLQNSLTPDLTTAVSESLARIS
ncbi:hypothetical protein SLA2020_327720 [Shorea laevis]